ncbi:hypothetical protein J4437_07815 [Candidatus Woesearchaeota archaeon]|nr:hypothetical protein [Candidatus Woesearchaeota archaeon]
MAMLYIHKLNQLHHKTADIESVYLIRELKQKTPYPLQTQLLHNYLSNFYIAPNDRQTILAAIEMQPKVMQKIEEISARQDELYEATNLHRSLQLLRDLPLALLNNLQYMDNLAVWQQDLAHLASQTFNSIPRLSSSQEKAACNEKLNHIFQTILRQDEFSFNPAGIVHEGPLADIQGLGESLQRGYLFHVTLEEELKKLSFEQIKLRIPTENLAEAKQLEQDVEIIKKGVECAYQSNMRTVNLALVLYSYVKWLMSGAI